MTLPAFLLGSLIALLYGAMFHLWKDGGPVHLAADLAAAWLGFWAGHVWAAFLGWQWERTGVLHFGAGTALALAFLLGAHVLLQPSESSD
jgi:hypothetical protein